MPRQRYAIRRYAIAAAMPLLLRRLMMLLRRRHDTLYHMAIYVTYYDASAAPCRC